VGFEFTADAETQRKTLGGICGALRRQRALRRVVPGAGVVVEG
jgi:hypothetical protein